jgi:hypothetical protein
MGINIAVRTTHDWRNEDQRWLGNGGIPFSPCKSIVLDRSKFDLVTTWPNGYLPSGLPLGRVTATGLYGPYSASPSEVQTLTRTSTGGTITLSFDGSPVSATIPATASGLTAAAVQTALEGLSTINPGDVTVTGVAGGPLTLTFGGRYVGQNVPQVVVDNTSATGGTVTAATGTAGAGSTTDGTEVLAGFLFTATETLTFPRDTSTANIAAALMWHGEVITNYLPLAVDAAGQADVAGWIKFTTNVV